MSNPVAVIDTQRGVIRAELFEGEAPVTVANFISLADHGFYNGLTFHRHEPGFVIQGGCPQGTGLGDSGSTIPLEVRPDLKHDRPGVLGMARSQAPDSASCQFYITLAPAGFLDMKYAVFGRVLSGIEAVNSLRKGDKIQSIRIERPDGQQMAGQ